MKTSKFLIVVLITLAISSFAITAPTSVSGLSATANRMARRTLIGGVAGGQVLYNLAPDLLNHQLTVIRKSGLHFVRSDLPWEYIQPSPGGYNWSHADLFMTALAKHGLSWLVILDYSATWASSDPGIQGAPPAHIPDFLNYVRAVVRRYGRGGLYWKKHPELPIRPVTTFEVWNEPNAAHYWAPMPNPAEYARLYVATRATVHEIDPGAIVISAGLAPNTGAFAYITAMFHAVPNLGSDIDAFGWHAYDSDARTALSEIRALRHLLRNEGAEDVPIDVTEFGWSTSGPGAISEATRVKYISTFVKLISQSGCDVRLVADYAWLTADKNPKDTQQWYGLANYNGTLKPAGLAYARSLQAPQSNATSSIC